MTRNLRKPLPEYSGVHQPGITDPRWPLEVPRGVNASDYREYAGRIDRQQFLTIVRADVHARTRAELQNTLRKLSEFADEEMKRKPSGKRMKPLEHLRDTYRVTLTIAFGASLFLTQQGDDRFGLLSQKPRFLKRMPRFFGDDPDFDPADRATDLAFLIASDHIYVNVAIARTLTDYFTTELKVRSIETGFSRPDKREFLRFDDGIDNIKGNELDSLVYVTEGDPEPKWCRGGSYMVYRKIEERLRRWEALGVGRQQEMIGRHKDSGRPLSSNHEPQDPDTPVFKDTDGSETPLTSHIRKVQPRREGNDFTGVHDLSRRFLRRPYPFYDGLGGDGAAHCGLQFVAFMKSPRDQFEWVVDQWQTNPDFPVPGTGRDALYEHGILNTIDGGYYFCPPAPRGEGDFIGRGMFEPHRVTMAGDQPPEESPSEEGMNLDYFMFDWDDNILFMPTLIALEVGGEPVNLTTSEYALVRKSGRYEPRGGDWDEAFAGFRDERGDFVGDARTALAHNRKAPSFFAFKRCLIEARLFCIITARGHEAETLRAGVEAFIELALTEAEQREMLENIEKFERLAGDVGESDGRLERFLDLNEYVGVTAPGFLAAHGGAGAEGAASPEKLKTQAIRGFVQRALKLASTLEVDVGRISFGFSDDDLGNIEVVREFLLQDLAGQFPEVEFFLYTTALGRREVEQI